ncbi:MAG: PEP-CTERM sorting domain-containing protein [Burkholderiales bacterium]|nr:PEP-CTERM sorting domain-containing protein [Burkholderiales bacterium]
MSRPLNSLVAALSLGMACAAASAATPVASYHFGGTLAADQAGVPALLALDPLGLNGFETATVHGASRSVYRWAGNGEDALQQAGLTLATSGLLADNASYSVALTFEFATTAPFGGGWRRVVDTEGRQSDNGFYVSPDQQLQAVQVQPIANGSTTFTTPGFHDVLLSVSPEAGQQRVKAYLDGRLEFSTLTDVFTLANPNNPDHLLTLFADNVAASAQQEYANGRIASLALYDGAITPSAVPEPQRAVLLLVGLGACVLRARRHRSA